MTDHTPQRRGIPPAIQCELRALQGKDLKNFGLWKRPEEVLAETHRYLLHLAGAPKGAQFVQLDEMTFTWRVP